MKKSSKYTTQGMCFGMLFGMAIGVSCGSLLFDNMSIGMCLGISFGMCLGIAFGAAKDKKINAQLEEEGYTVHRMVKKGNSDDYTATIRNKAGEESVVDVTAEEMKKENFAEGDFVFLDNNHIEQAYAKEDLVEKEDNPEKDSKRKKRKERKESK